MVWVPVGAGPQAPPGDMPYYVAATLALNGLRAKVPVTNF